MQELGRPTQTLDRRRPERDREVVAPHRTPYHRRRQSGGRRQNRHGFLGLPFEEGCLNYYRTDRSIRTPSSEQVRQPIYQSGLEHWRHYEPWLDVLKRELADEIAGYPETPSAG